MTLTPLRRVLGSSLARRTYPTLTTLLLLLACSDAPVNTEPGTPTNPNPGTPTAQTGSIAGTLIFPGGVGSTSLNGVGETDSTAKDTETPDLSFIPGEVIVKFASDTQLQSLSVQGLSLQRAQTAGLPRTALYRTQGLGKRETLALIEDLNARPDVVYAEPNTVQTIQKVPNDEFYPYQWHYEAMNLPAAWDIEDGTSNSITVAVVDSGSIPHPDLQSVLLPGYDFISDPTNAADGDGYDPDPTDLSRTSGYHGAHVAGTVAASTNNGSGVAGVSWGAKVVPIRALGNAGGSTFDIALGILWAAGEKLTGIPTNPNPAQVINLSIGGASPCNQYYQEAIGRARAKGVIVVAAAGNENTNVSSSQPANCDGVIAVGATGPQNARAPYSNYGVGIDIMAPGGDRNQSINVNKDIRPASVLSTSRIDEIGEYVYSFENGTSMAAPHISGLVALMLAKEPSLDPDTILARLKASAEPLSASECGRALGSECGAGLVNAAAALGGASDLPPQPETERVNTYVIAFHCTTVSCTAFDESRSKFTTLSATQLEAPFHIKDLESGTYFVAAWQDLNDDLSIDDNEPFGAHPADVTLRSGGEVRGADIYLEALTPQSIKHHPSALLKGAKTVLQRSASKPR